MHEDKILLRLKRKYTKDEEVSFILKALADAQFENGVLKSEIAELKANKRVEKKKAEKPKEPAYPETVVNNFIGKILAKGGINSTTDELCRNVAKSANAHSNYRQPAFCQYIVSCRFSSSYNMTKHIKK